MKRGWRARVSYVFAAVAFTVAAYGWWLFDERLDARLHDFLFGR